MKFFTFYDNKGMAFGSFNIYSYSSADNFHKIKFEIWSKIINITAHKIWCILI